MRKKIVAKNAVQASVDNQIWLDLDALGAVELTSEQSDWPIENALFESSGPGWRASECGMQSIQIIFDQPQPLTRILLEFVETEQSRTQEHAIRFSSDQGKNYSEVVRQQWNFDPQGSVHEVEDYSVRLEDVTNIELQIIPDIQGGTSLASLNRLRLA